MNCRFSNDSLPRHVYNNWDSVYSWYVNGKTFSAGTGTPNINANTPITITSAKPVPDPFWQSQGRLLNLTSGTLRNKFDSITYTIPGFGTFKRYGNQILPNSSLTFHEYVFRYCVNKPYTVKLTLTDSVNHASGELASCTSVDTINLSHSKPDAHGLDIKATCPWEGVKFSLAPNGKNAGTKPTFGQTYVLVNLDSLADRKDNTPCTLDGFTDYQGGTTAGGIYRPPFYSLPNFNPFSQWPDAKQPSFNYKYFVPTAPPADSLGFVTIGLIIGSGCANPPSCTQPTCTSDTVWYHNYFRLQFINAAFTINEQNKLHYKNEIISVIPSSQFQDSVKVDLWSWGDLTTTVDSFWYAGYDVTDGFYVHGMRRVRYNIEYDKSYNFNNRIIDSIVFPLGLPQTAGKYYSIPSNTWDYCHGKISSNPSFSIRDSAMMSVPVTHKYRKTSFEMYGPSNGEATITNILRFVQTTNSCQFQMNSLLTIGVIDTLRLTHEGGAADSVFCKNESVYFNDSVRYFRYDNDITNPAMQNFGRSRNQIYSNMPEMFYQFDTIDFWANHSNNSSNILSISLNPITLKYDTFYNERIYWDFGDGTPIYQGVKPIHKYTGNGKYKVTMVSRDSIGHLDTCISFVNISGVVARPTIANTPFGCKDTAYFHDSSYTTNGGKIALRYWRFYSDAKDSFTVESNLQDPVWYYTRNGKLNATLTSISARGCSAIGSLSFFRNGPRPGFRLFSNPNGCVPYRIGIKNLADSADMQNAADSPTLSTFIYWGDGSNTALTGRRDTAWHTYTGSGSYIIMAAGRDALPMNMVNCPVVYFPDTASGQKTVLINVSQSNLGKINGRTNPYINDTATYFVPNEAGATYLWTVQGGTVQTGTGTNSIRIKWPATSGIYNVIIQKTNYIGCTFRDTLSVHVLMTAINDLSSVSEIKMYPNPANKEVTISMKSQKNQDLNIKIYDILGKVCMSDIIKLANGLVNKNYALNEMSKGMYFVEISNGEEKTVFKLLIE